MPLEEDLFIRNTSWIPKNKKNVKLAFHTFPLNDQQ